MANQTAGLNVNITDNAKQAASNLNTFTAAAQKAQQVVKDFSQGLVTGAREAWQEHSKAAQNAVTPTKQFSDQVQKSNDIVTRFADTLTRRFITGVIITQLRQFTQQLVAMNAELVRTSDLASRSGGSPQNLQGLISAAGVSGIDPKEFLDGYEKLNQQVNLAKRGTGDLLTLFSKNGIKVTDTADAFEQILRLVSSTNDELAKANFLQAGGLGATTQWLRLADQGPAKIKAIADSFSKVTDEEFKAAAKLDEDFNRAWVSIQNGGKAAFVSVGLAAQDVLRRSHDDADQLLNIWRQIKNLSDSSVRNVPAGNKDAIKGSIAFANRTPNGGVIGNSKIPTVFGSEDIGLNMRNPLAGDESAGLNMSRTPAQIVGKPFVQKEPFDPERAKTENQQITQQIGLLGSLATADDLVKAKKAELFLADLNHIHISPQMQSAIIAETRLQKDASDASAKLQLGLATEADIRKQIMAGIPPALRARAEETEAVKKQTEQLRMNSEVAASALPGLKQLELNSKDLRIQLDTLGQGITNGISGPLVDLASGATKAGDAFKQMGLNVIRSIEQMIVNMTIAAPIARGLQSILGGFLPGAGIGAAGQPTMLGDATLVTSANGNIFPNAPGISAYSNTIVDRPTIFPFAKGIGLMGEAGAEAIMPLTRIGGKLGVRASGGSSDTYIDMSGMNITLPQDPNGNDPTGAVRSNAVAKALEGTVRNIVKDEMIMAQKPRGMLNRASAI